MITNNERTAVQLSATKKDYYQIWNELLELAGKISDRWDPTSTNESDPGIVLLKVLTALGDKLNYNIDANILEAFMPSAAQMESMRKLCDMMGYNIKYYQSAITNISFAYVGDDSKISDDTGEWRLYLPMFTAITNADRDVNYVTIEDKFISNTLPSQTILCMEGQVVRCESENNNIITINQLDDHNRYYLPENQIAENGIFIYRINDGLRSDRWQKVENLNTQSFKTLVYKFGFDSLKNKPYIQFPDDIGQIIEDGLEIYYIRTSGLSGNISPRVLNTFEKPAIDNWKDVTVEDFNITNNSAATNGTNIESIEQAYDNYKKTIGTFDTLVTCRDYMNAIYNMMNEADTPVVSNVIVTDIRDDINKAITLCGFDDYGIKYTDLKVTSGDINTFDLILYPFKKVFGLNTKEEYQNSFKLDNSAATKQLITTKLANNKTIAHNIKYPNREDISCIKNYLKLDAKISTTKKINSIEEAELINTIKIALYEQFNARKLDFGEEIPFDAILECIENADARIKNVALGEPILYTKFELADGREYDTASYDVVAVTGAHNKKNLTVTYPGKEVYNKLALRNILAGRIELFNYNRQFRYDLSESPYDYTYELNNPDIQVEPYSTVYPVDEAKKIVAIKPKCSFKLNPNKPNNQIKLTENELIKFRAPNFKTKVTYPAYVNYFLHLETAQGTTIYEKPATFKSLRKFLTNDRWNALSKTVSLENFKSLDNLIFNEQTFDLYKETYGALFKIDDQTGVVELVTTNFEEKTTYYCLPINISTFPLWVDWITSQTYIYDTNKTANYLGIYRSLGYSFTRPIGYLVDTNHNKYQECLKWHTVDEKAALDYYFVQEVHAETKQTTVDGSGTKTYGYTADGLGADAEYTSIPKDTEYQLKPGEYLAINYTPAVEGDKTGSEAEPINILYTGANKDIIKPNFDLKDSVALHTLTNRPYQKNSGYTFKGMIESLDELPGMYSLDIHEQIEIRDFVQVELTNNITYLYWTLKDEEATIKNIDAQIVAPGMPKSYTLQDGEYIYYTDINKTALAYYGSGTEILFYNGAKFIEKKDKKKEVSADDILNKGLSIIPWITFNFGTGATDEKIILKEYQYITLAKEDTLDQIYLTGNETVIDSNWKAVDNGKNNENRVTKYTLSGITKTLPIIAIDNMLWQVKSQLTLDISPIKTQFLAEHDTLELIYDDESSTMLAPRLDNDKNVVNLSLRSNYTYQTTTDEVNVKTVRLTQGETQTEVNDFSIKLFETKPVGVVSSKTGQLILDTNAVQLNNFGKKWTSYFFRGMNSRDDYLKLYLNIPENHFGLVMVNCSNYSGNSSITDRAFIQITNNITQPKIYNYYRPNGLSESWWDKYSQNSKYFLHKGINIIKIEKACILEIHPDSLFAESVIFSNLDIIPNNSPLNIKILDCQMPIQEHYTEIDADEKPDRDQIYMAQLKNSSQQEYIKYIDLKADSFDTNKYIWFKKLQSEDNITVDKMILNTINQLDPEHQFYYNCPLDASSAIDLNTKLIGTELEEHLSDTHIWYDKNNINNNFVISEIDAEYLDSGIQIARASKL